ncbi:ABC transporter ATP-binding protein [Micromonospora sp. WMMA2032]|uniref:ABC-2 type transport system ATP-binding protein n=1 Tax=Micromonospora sediminicola TaxID=946078 RepID=A0A1A9BCY2_9ACTN|nr:MULTISPECIES: ABC transporter ATP-binding protein [Micromonospora]ATO13286.1 ABC transporter ATP-binding protein [Micromonospora sp. WMMA2032]PGH45011.1 ABC transporter ATP-binding protein [Micromonospora sp. WMMA1996]SBT66849.1 ABC-2 type transport system ATP-binding protein [Micromonospora sediminicola]
MDEAVVVDGLVKRYRPDMPPAVDGLSFSVAAGEVFGLLGPNGAGKTTTIGVLTTRVRATSGRALVCGADVSRAPAVARQLLAVVPQRVNLDRSLTVRQNLLFHSAYHRVSRSRRSARADELLEQMGLTAFATARTDFLSGGLAQRTMIARALMHAPRVLFLDEPSAGLDPQSRLFVHERIAELKRSGVTVVVTTHDMEEAEKLCDRVGIVDHGKLLTLDTPAALTRTLPGSSTLTLVVAPGAPVEAVQAALADVPDVERVERLRAGGAAELPMFPGMPPMPLPDAPADPDAPLSFRVYTAGAPANAVPMALKVLTDLGCEVRDLSVGQPSLEDVFIHLTGRELR